MELKSSGESLKGIVVAKSGDRLARGVESDEATGFGGNGPDRLQLLAGLKEAMTSRDELALEYSFDLCFKNSDGEFATAVDFYANVLTGSARDNPDIS